MSLSTSFTVTRMNVRFNSVICTNSMENGSINKAMSGGYWDKIKIEKSTYWKKSLYIDLNELESLKVNSLSEIVVYYPESQRKSVHFDIGAEIEIPILPGDDRYLNILLLDYNRFIKYSNTVIIESESVVLLDDRKLASDVRAELLDINISSDELRVKLSVDQSIGSAFSVLQTINNQVNIPILIDGNMISIVHRFDRQLPPEIWMLCIGDSNNRYLSQACMEIYYE